jgi:hypothetical protein
VVPGKAWWLRQRCTGATSYPHNFQRRRIGSSKLVLAPPAELVDYKAFPRREGNKTIMSLTQRVTSIEEHEPCSRESSPRPHSVRKMSFNPVGTWTEQTGEEPTIGAFEVPKWKRLREHFQFNCGSTAS